MKDKDIFDILENAENDSMERLADKCPEISDKELDKILEMSERKYNMKKNNTIVMTDNDIVEGVERSRRPAWINTLSMAASILLVLGFAVGGISYLKNSNTFDPSDNNDPIPVVTEVTTGTTAATTTAQETDVKTTSESKASTTVTAVSSASTETAVSSETETETTETATTAEEAVTSKYISTIAGTWTYQVSSGNYSVDEGHNNNGIVVINTDGTYSYTLPDGSVTSGTVEAGEEEIGGSKLTNVYFYSGGEFQFGGSLYPLDNNIISIGNGGMARLVRGIVSESSEEPVSKSQDFAGTWYYQVSSGNYSVEEGHNDNGVVVINADGTYIYTLLDGNVTSGTVEVSEEEIGGSKLTNVYFYSGGEFQFGGSLYPLDNNIISIGNGGLARLVRG